CKNLVEFFLPGVIALEHLTAGGIQNKHEQNVRWRDATFFGRNGNVEGYFFSGPGDPAFVAVHISLPLYAAGFDLIYLHQPHGDAVLAHKRLNRGAFHVPLRKTIIFRCNLRLPHLLPQTVLVSTNTTVRNGYIWGEQCIY